MKIDLSKRVAVVTGSSGQLGRTMARSLAECGADVALCYYRNAAYAGELKARIEGDYGVRAHALRLDVTDQASIAAARDEIRKVLGAADIVVTNAVVQIPEWKSVLEQEAEAYESQFRSCVMHNVYMAKAFVPDMIERGRGRIIGINTECAMQGFPAQSAYVSGKRGMDGVLRVLAKEVGRHNVTVNQVAPGWTISDNSRDADGSERNIAQDYPYVERVPMGRRGSDQEIANAVCFLASDLAGFITGVYLPVCGGNVMPCI
jgi:3-oxoacyl-[acyl-carrier protein] reductase